MKPTRPVGHNWTYGPPAGLEESVGSLEVRRELDGPYPELYSAWEPSDEEREWLRHGAHIELGVHGMVPPPPVSVNVRAPACRVCGEETQWMPALLGFACEHPEHDDQPGLGEKHDRPDPYPAANGQDGAGDPSGDRESPLDDPGA